MPQEVAWAKRAALARRSFVRRVSAAATAKLPATMYFIVLYCYASASGSWLPLIWLLLLYTDIRVVAIDDATK